MGEQLGASGVPGAPSANGLPDIAAAKAIIWNVELERGLRLTRPGAPCEAILKTGPRMLWWNDEPISSVETATLYKLVDGQDKTFANAMVQRLADSFRTGNNFTRLCILKAFFLVSKSIRRRGRRDGTGLFKKERIANYQEVLKRVKSVMDSGDVVARALALRMLGCLGEIAADSLDVQRLVIEALESPHQKEVEAALFAMGCLCELSLSFAEIVLEKVVEIANAMGSSPATKLSAIRVFSKLGVSPHLAFKAHEAGESLMLRLPTTDIVSAMLTSLTMLALNSIFTIERQVELLFAYVSSDPRAAVRAVALHCLSKLASQAARSLVSRNWNFSILLSVAEDTAAAPALRVLAFNVLQKLSGHFVRVVDRSELFRLLLTVELNLLQYAGSLRRAALECLGSFGCELGFLRFLAGSDYPDADKPTLGREFTKEVSEGEQIMYNGNSISKNLSRIPQSNMNFAARVGLLLCDTLALEGSTALIDRNKVTGGEIQETKNDFDPTRLQVITRLVARLMQSCPEVLPMILDSISSLIKAATQKYVQDVRLLIGKQEAVTSMDTDSKESTEPKVSLRESESVGSGLEVELEFVLSLCHCMYAGVRGAGTTGMDSNSACIILPKLLDLTKQVSGDDSACHILRATLPPLLRIWSLSGRSSNDRKNIESYITKCIDQMSKIGEVWVAYKVASEAATNGFWSPVYTLVDELTRKVHSEGCYLWLLSLSLLATAERTLGFCNKEHLRSSDSPVPTSAVNDTEKLMDIDTGYMNSAVPEPKDQGDNFTLKFGDAAAKAIPLLRQVGSVLAAGVCSERTFEFQRWFVSIRLRMVQSVTDILQILNLVLSSHSLPNTTKPAVDMNMDCAVPAFESSGVDCAVFDNIYDRRIQSTFKSAKARASIICTQLMHLSKELDILGLSFLGLDEESLECLCEAAINCSLISFCTYAVFTVGSTSADNVRGHPTVQNLHFRLKHINGFEGLDLLQTWIGTNNESEDSLVGGCPRGAIVKVCGWAIKIISRLERGSPVLKQQSSLQDVPVEPLRFLQLLIGECSQLPFPIPKYFFCTRPRAAVELFVAQTGGEEVTELSVKQGSSLLLSICAQLTNVPVGISSRISSLFCVLSFHGVESASLVEEDLYADWKLGWHEGQASNQSLIDFSLVEKLVQRATCDDVQDAIKLEQELLFLPTLKEDTFSRKGVKGSAKKAGAFGRSFTRFIMDQKGKGFSSCNLDVASFPVGQYQLSFESVGVDTNNRPWVLIPSRIRETLKITASSTNV